MEIKSLEGVPFNLIYNAFSSAFEEYEVQLNKQQLIKMLKRRGFDPGLSFAFFDNCDMVAFILNGIGNFGGIATAYYVVTSNTCIKGILFATLCR